MREAERVKKKLNFSAKKEIFERTLLRGNIDFSRKLMIRVCGRSYGSSRRSSADKRFVAHAIVRALFNCLASSFA